MKDTPTEQVKPTPRKLTIPRNEPPLTHPNGMRVTKAMLDGWRKEQELLALEDDDDDEETPDIPDTRDTPFPKAYIEEVEEEETPVTTSQTAQPIGPQDDEDMQEHVSGGVSAPEIDLDSTGVSAVEPEEGDLVITYVRGESVISIFDPTQEAPLTSEFEEPQYTYSQDTATVSRITRFDTTPRYCYGCNIWIRAKTSISQQLAHDSLSDTGKKKTLDEMLPPQYQEYR